LRADADEEEGFFFEKKNQKTFIRFACVLVVSAASTSIS